jgi:hypothetical protein
MYSPYVLLIMRGCIAVPRKMLEVCTSPFRNGVLG